MTVDTMVIIDRKSYKISPPNFFLTKEPTLINAGTLYAR